MLQLDAEVEWSKTVKLKDNHVPGTLRDIVFLAICLVTKPLTAIGSVSVSLWSLPPVIKHALKK